MQVSQVEKIYDGIDFEGINLQVNMQASEHTIVLLAYSLQLCMCFAFLCTDTLETVLSVTITFMNIPSKWKRMGGEGREEGRRREGREE